MSMRRAVALFLALAVSALFAVGLSSPAGAVDNPTYTAPPPTTPVTSPEPVRTDEVETAVQREQVRTTLAITGSSTATLAAFGSLLVGAGVAVLYGRRHALSD